MVRRGQISVGLTPETTARLKAASERSKVSISHFAERLIERGLDRFEGKVEDVTREDLKPILELCRLLNPKLIKIILQASLTSLNRFVLEVLPDNRKDIGEKIKDVVARLLPSVED